MQLRPVMQLVSCVALAATILPSVGYLFGAMKLEAAQWAMCGAAIVWFAVTPFWMGRDVKEVKEEASVV